MRHREPGAVAVRGSASTERPVRMRFGSFVSDLLARECGGRTERASRYVVNAIRWYLDDKGSDRPGWRHPPFLSDRAPARGVDLDLRVDRGLWQSLQVEAAFQSVTMRQMLEHATIYFAAAVDAGRAGTPGGR